MSVSANRFELRCEPKRLMLLYYKICPCSGKEEWRREQIKQNRRKEKKNGEGRKREVKKKDRKEEEGTKEGWKEDRMTKRQKLK